MFDLKAVEAALETLALAYIEERRKPGPQKPGGITPTPFHFDGEGPLKTTLAEIYREDIVKHPIVGALRLAIRELGEHAFENGVTLNGMQDMLEGIAARNPKHSGAIASAVDHAWDGIGRTADKPG